MVDSSARTRGHVVELDLSSGVHESPSSGFFVPRAASGTYAGLVRGIERAAMDSNARGFFLRLGETEIGWAQSEELGAALGQLRERGGRPVICHAHSLGNATAWLALRACSRLWLSPAGSVDTVGISGQVVYVKGALDKLKIRADLLHMGRYKSAGEALTQDGPSDEARESLTAVLSSIRKTWLDSGALSRKRPDIAASLEGGPWSAHDAKERGLVDEVGYEDDARRDAEERTKSRRTVATFGRGGGDDSSPGLTEIVRLLAGGEAPSDRPHVAVVPAEGSITMGGGGVLSDAGITARALQKVIRRLAEDDAVKAVVLRVDSPGGSALASDLLWHELMNLRKKKPLVASIGDMAASGGYYLACAATKVVAERTSIVGSIGVVGGKIVIDEALAQFGINAETFPASSADGARGRAAYLSPLEPWDEPTRERVRTGMQAIYDLFVRRVSQGRNLPIEIVQAVAEGRIWSGAQGHKLGLIDELGGLGKAVHLAMSLASLDGDTPVRIEGGETLLESFFTGDVGEEASVLAMLFGGAKPHGARLLEPLARSFRPFVGAFAPLVDGETAVVALPFALVVE